MLNLTAGRPPHAMTAQRNYPLASHAGSLTMDTTSDMTLQGTIMNLNAQFTAQPVLAAAQLPLTLMALTDWQLVNVSGVDAQHYLQGQLTLDVPALTAQQHALCAHCDAKGKLWSTLRLWRRGDGFAYLLRRSVAELQLLELKKYAVFAKVTLANDPQAIVLGLAGAQASEALRELFSDLPDANCPLRQAAHSQLLFFADPQPRYLVVCDDEEEAKRVIQRLRGRARLSDGEQWLALDIEAGLAIIDEASCDQFLPQAVNLQALGGISFTKGCYSGQEMVARAKYRGANRRALFWLRGSAGRLPHASEDLELRLGDSWRRSGTVLAAQRLANGEVYIQAVLSNDLAADSVWRVRDDERSQLTIAPLPYTLDDAE
ncbi:tRNA-modifying protein ygfZ [Edwardsiella hoshinae]|uniref:tRNA-modifying protein YgfZ n=2 Tax=Edwardsiella hoshinae TaxID=93378 RepID=A0A376D7L5_9GAMM|nr:tRNA-modifying protein ygfZ [Edwardsiella hoshinae]